MVKSIWKKVLLWVNTYPIAFLVTGIYTSSDPYLSRHFDKIESSLQRIHNAIKDVQVYESTELLEQLHRQVSPKTLKG